MLQEGRSEISWPTEITPAILREIDELKTQGKSLAASIALVILEEGKTIRGQQGVLIPQVEYGYTRPAFALLNAEEFIRSGQPFQNAEEDERFKLQIYDRYADADFDKRIQRIAARHAERQEEPFQAFDIDQQVETDIMADKIEWYLREESLVGLLKSNEPLAFVDEITKREKLRGDLSREGIEALEKGQQRFHQLYEKAR